MGGLMLGQAWRTVMGYGCANRSGGARVRQGVEQDFGFGFGVRISEVSTAPAWFGWRDGGLSQYW